MSKIGIPAQLYDRLIFRLRLAEAALVEIAQCLQQFERQEDAPDWCCQHPDRCEGCPGVSPATTRAVAQLAAEEIVGGAMRRIDAAKRRYGCGRLDPDPVMRANGDPDVAGS
jgi:hypothetical protein